MTAEKEIKTGRPPGRPRKFAPRVHATTRLAPKLHTELMEAATGCGRSLSEEIEWRIERLAAYDSAMAAMRTSLEQIAAGNLEATLWRLGFTPVRHTPSGKKAWLEPGYPGVQRSGFVAPYTPEEWAAHVQHAEAMGVDFDRIEQENARKLREADQRPPVDFAATLDRLDRIADEAGIEPVKPDEAAAAPPAKDDAA
jgi:hypothetical protein